MINLKIEVKLKGERNCLHIFLEFITITYIYNEKPEKVLCRKEPKIVPAERVGGEFPP